MNDVYVPFLKLKANEIGALKVMEVQYLERLFPFFDLPRKNDLTEEELIKVIDRSARSVKINLDSLTFFYLDDFDIDDRIQIDGVCSYQYILSAFSGLAYVPVVALDRSDERNNVVLDGKSSGLIESSRVAIRLQTDDFEDYQLCQDEFDDILEACEEKFDVVDLVFDCRCCLNKDSHDISENIGSFFSEICGAGQNRFDRYIVSGSSVPSSITDLVATNDKVNIERKEIEIFRLVRHANASMRGVLGDYGIVSPDYSDISIDPRNMRNVTAPKILYPFDDSIFIVRGGALKTHPRQALQYNDMCADLVAKSFYRRQGYSWGDDYIQEKADGLGKGVTPSSILKPTINAHMTYMIKDHAL